jgi:hypothetical protein
MNTHTSDYTTTRRPKREDIFWSFGPEGELRPPEDQPWMPTIWPDGTLTWPPGVSRDRYDLAVKEEEIGRAAYTSEGLFWDMDAATARAKRLWELYRLTPEDHTKIFARQGYVCAISKKPSKHYGTDHDHITGLIRGIIDWRINRGLAFFNDDPKLLRAAADYLDSPPATAALGAPRYGLLGRAKQGKKNKVYGPATKLPKRRQ